MVVPPAAPAPAPALPTLAGTAFGFDFNPTVDRIRLVSDAEQNLRLNPDNGAVAATDGPLAYAAGDRNAGRDPAVTGSAYTNSVRGATATTLFGIDTTTDALVVQNPPNAGTLTTVGAGLGFDAREGVGFDIATSGAAYAVSRNADDTASELHLVNLGTGAATAVSEPRIGLSGQSIRALAATGDVDDDRQAPRISVASSSAQLASGLLARGLQFTVACDETCVVSGRVTVAGRRAGTVSGVVEGAGRVRLTIDLSEQAEARLRRVSTRLLLRIDVEDGAGNDTEATRTIRSR